MWKTQTTPFKFPKFLSTTPSYNHTLISVPHNSIISKILTFNKSLFTHSSLFSTYSFPYSHYSCLCTDSLDFKYSEDISIINLKKKKKAQLILHYLLATILSYQLLEPSSSKGHLHVCTDLQLICPTHNNIFLTNH